MRVDIQLQKWPKSPVGVPERESNFKNSLHSDIQYCIPGFHPWVMVTVTAGEAVNETEIHTLPWVHSVSM